MAAPSVPLKGKEIKETAPKGVPPARMASDKSDKVGKEKSKVDETPKMKTDVEKVENIKAEKGKKKKIVKQKEISKKDVAVANGFSLKISPKQSK